jgi:N-formylglutamate amidohydrolase
MIREIDTSYLGDGTDRSHKIAILHIPHSSRSVPKHERQAIRLDDAALEGELLRMTDAYTDELFPVTPFEAGRVVFPISRLICDVERFPADEDEPMAARGMGVFYVRTSLGEVLREPPGAEVRQSLLDRWYWPHHSKLERRVDDVLAGSGRCLIIDCHSFPSVALPYEMDQREERPDFCIGTDDFHTPPPIRNTVVAAVVEAGHTVTVNAPFSGALVPLSSYRKNGRVSSVMIEVNRRLYMDERSGRKLQEFDDVCAVVGRLITRAAEAAVHELPGRQRDSVT